MTQDYGLRPPHYSGLPTARLSEAGKQHADLLHRLVGDNPAAQAALYELVREAAHASRDAARATVDRDRGINDALARAQDCGEHGKQIRFLEEQVAHFDRVADRTNQARIALLQLLRSVEALAQSNIADLTVEGLINGLTATAAKAASAHQRAWSKVYGADV